MKQITTKPFDTIVLGNNKYKFVSFGKTKDLIVLKRIMTCTMVEYTNDDEYLITTNYPIKTLLTKVYVTK